MNTKSDEEYVKSIHPGAYAESDSNGVSIRVRDENKPISNLRYYGRGSNELLAWANLARKLRLLEKKG